MSDPDHFTPPTQADPPLGATPATAPSPPKDSDLDVMRSGLNEAAGVCGAIWLSFLFFEFYLAISSGAVTHLDLFLERAVKLPVLNIDLPLLAYFCLAPVLLVISHAYVLLHLAILSERARRFRAMAAECEGAGAAAIPGRGGDLRPQLSSDVFVQFLAGPRELRSGEFAWALRAVAWGSLAVAPILVLLLLQAQFLPYQSAAITWLHRVAILLDFALLWWLGRSSLTLRQAKEPQGAGARWAALLGKGAMAITVLFSCFVLAHEDEPKGGQERSWTPQHAVLRSDIDAISRRPFLPFSNRLVLTDVNIADLAGALSAAAEGKTEFVYRARGRNFRGAIFDHAILTKVDFAGAHLEGASFYYSDLDDSNFDGSGMDGASFRQSKARGASFEDAHLAHADFSSANLAAADFKRAKLPQAVFADAGLRAAEFDGADLSETSLTDAVIFGASFKSAVLSKATFERAEISASDFAEANLDSAKLTDVKLDLNDFSRAQLRRASGLGAVLGKSSVEGLEAGDTPASRELGQKFEAVRVDVGELRNAQASLFATNLCVDAPDNAYVMKSAIFALIDGLDAETMIDHLLSSACVTSSLLSDEERAKLRSRRMEAMRKVGDTSARACERKNETVAETKLRAPDVAGGFPTAPAADR